MHAGRKKAVAREGCRQIVGNTPIVELRRLVPDGHARIFAKVEGQNPTGSMIDRMALSVVDRAAESGRLAPSGTIVEYTGGSTGTSLAFVCAARGYPMAANETRGQGGSGQELSFGKSLEAAMLS